jgi:demethylmenaquinone methyltransferase/2-methoxy-6-polyprenyl-1,4-benzoquinol methylase
VCGIDLSDGMFEIAQARVQGAGVAERVNLRVGDAVQLPFEAGTVDAAFMSFTLELFDTPEIPLVLSQCQTVLHPDGRICVVSMARKEKLDLAVRIYEWFHEKMPSAVDCRPIFAQVALKEAGFEVRDVTELSMWGLPVEIILATKKAN